MTQRRAVEIPSKGILIGVEGPDAAGKRTQSKLLDSWLRSKGISVATISFPDYSTIIGGEIKLFLHGKRSYSHAVQHILFAANRWENHDRIVELLRNNQAVIVNRYTESNLAYGTANGLKLDWLVNLEEGLPKTDVVLVLDAPPGALFNRRGDVRKDTWEGNLRFQEAVRSAYVELAPRLGWTVLDASKGVDETHKSVADVVSKVLTKMNPLPQRRA